MTEELALVIKNATCKKCLGEGTLAWRADVTLPGGVIVLHFNTIPCDVCGGDGCDPDY